MIQRVLAVREERRIRRVGLAVAAILILTLLTAAQSPATTQRSPVASGWTLIKYPQGQPACTGLGFIGSIYYDRLDCGFGYVQVSETTLAGPASTVKVSFIDSTGT